ncbi:hypothetical protein SDC9_195748 [bioreactor metagenome]|uniref:Uncharacterized protein n=1 Tax=bioreactor metagenome TaxID=1076179 RepID=A0A645ILE1_9ZZZZ
MFVETMSAGFFAHGHKHAASAEFVEMMVNGFHADRTNIGEKNAAMPGACFFNEFRH